MTKKELMDLGLDEAMAESVLAAHVEQMRGYVPRSRLNEEIAARRAAEELSAAHEAKIKELGEADQSEALRQRIRELEEAQKKLTDDHAAEIHRMRVDSAVDAALVAAKARNAKAVKALLSGLDRAELDTDGSVKGLAEQIAALQAAEDSKFLFDSAQRRKLKGAYVGEDGVDDGDGAPDLSRMSYAELAAYLAEHPGAELAAKAGF